MFLFYRAQEANERYTTKFITALYEEEAKGVFITRESVLGHLQQVTSVCYEVQQFFGEHKSVTPLVYYVEV